MSTPPRHVVLLGAQRTNPTLARAVDELGVERLALVTAGWQEREDEDEELSLHLGRRTVNLRLYARADALFAADPELARAYRERQQRLRERLDFYRVRMAHAIAADHVIRQRRAPPAIVLDETQASTDAIRALDTWHLARCREHQRAFADALDLDHRAELLRHRREIAELVAACDGIAIAGGHVATLRNRLVLFDVAKIAGARPIFAWSGGAMVVTDRLVLFNDSPPEGAARTEVLDDGLGLVHDVVVFPQPETRLDFDDTEHVAARVERFLPAACLVLPARARVTWTGDRVTHSSGAFELRSSGAHAPFTAAGEAVR